MIVVDSSVWINHFRGVLSAQVRWLRSFDPGESIVVGDIIVLEVLRGAQDDLQAARLEAGFAEHGIVTMLDAQLAITAASHYRKLRSLGVTAAKVPDLIIATFCIVHGHELLHQDRDFTHFERHLGLKVLH